MEGKANTIRPPGPLEIARRRAGLRQIDLASRAGLCQATIRLAESGYVPSPGSRHAIADALGVDVAELWPGVGR